MEGMAAEKDDKEAGHGRLGAWLAFAAAVLEGRWDCGLRISE
jgi:hypothetical protein